MASEEFIAFCKKQGIQVESLGGRQILIRYANKAAILEYNHTAPLSGEKSFDVLADLRDDAQVINYGKVTDVVAFANWATDRDIQNPQVGEEYYREVRKHPGEKVTSPLVTEAYAWVFEHENAGELQRVLGTDFEAFMEAR